MNDTNEEIVFETEHWKVVLVPDQLYLGRSVLVLKRPSGDPEDLAIEEWLGLREVLRKLALLFRKVFDATMFNRSCLMNSDYLKDPPKPQVHLHFRPRYDHPVEFNGQMFKDPNFGYHAVRDEEHQFLVPAELLRAISKRLQDELEKSKKEFDLLADFPKYLMKVNGERKFYTFRDAYILFNSGSLKVEFGRYVLEKDMRVRRMSVEDRNEISEAADRFDESK